jgi:hypothetical protein
MELFCGREWCPFCGQEWSPAHQRRFSRWLQKGFQMTSMGYFVFTLPVEQRGKYRTKKALSQLGHDIQELLKRYGYKRGLRRWHYFGDKSPEYHPHLNVIVDGGWLAPDSVKEIRREYAVLLGVNIVDVFYRYRKTAVAKTHCLKYVTRATFKDCEWDYELATNLRGFVNMVSWGRGKWNMPAAWSLDDLKGEARKEIEGVDIKAVNSLESGECPKCHSPIAWSKVLPLAVLAAEDDKRSLGAGYWELPEVKPSPWNNTIATRLTYAMNKHGDDGGHYNYTYNGFHERHRAFAEQWQLDRLMDASREDWWHDILLKDEHYAL